jgi:hypothetical protein
LPVVELKGEHTMGIARTITGIPSIIIVLIALAAIGLSTWSITSKGGQQLESLVERGVDKYDAYLPEITIKQGQASIREKQPYFLDTGDKDFVAVIDTREDKQSAALDYLKDVQAGIVLTRTSITIKNQHRTQIVPLKEFPDMVLNSRSLSEIARNFFPMVIQVGTVLVAFYVLFAKLFQVFILALAPYLAARSYNTELTYGQALKISVVAMIPPLILDMFLGFPHVGIPGWFFFYFLTYVFILALITIELVRSSPSGTSSSESIHP